MKQDLSAGKIAGLLFLEAAVIFAGITSSFWIEEWRQNREDVDTYHHLLEEIYYNSVFDQGSVPIAIATNNLALKYAMELAILDVEVPADRDLYTELAHVFGGVGSATNTTGYVRLSNTPLSIPFDETMATLDNVYGQFMSLQDAMETMDEELRELRTEHWSSAGFVSCTGAQTNDGAVTLMARPYMAEIRELLYPEGECITQAENERKARELITRAEFRNVLRQVIEIRQGAAWVLGWQQGALGQTRSAIAARLPEVGLSIVSMELVNWPVDSAVVGSEASRPMSRTGPHTWETVVDLPAGYIKFRANDSWDYNWGAPFPNLTDAPGDLWSSDRVLLEDVFPSGAAAMNGMNLPISGGRYRVTFNSRTGEYLFEEVQPAS